MRLIVTHSAITFHAEKHFSPAITVDTLKDKLYVLCGTAPDDMRLVLRDRAGADVCELSDGSRSLESYPQMQDLCEIHVVDESADSQARLRSLTDVKASGVAKLVMSDEDYDRREDTFRKWKAANVAPKAAAEAPKQSAADKYMKAPEGVAVGNRCMLKNALQSRGEVKFVGETSFASGFWIGIQLDEPYGKNDGSVKGKRYFTCDKTYGIFLRFDKIEVGDFPEETFGSDDEF